MIQQKKCKGQGKAISFKGCGKMVNVAYRKYGLCSSCYAEFLTETEVGKIIMQKGMIKGKENLKKEEKKKDKETKESLMTKSDYLNLAQKVFNTYIRHRDKGKPCISCDKFLKENDVNASHYFSVGSSPNLRFNEDNVHSSCIKCNKELHGNIAEYAIRLPLRIGKERFEQLQQDRNKPALYTIDDIKELIKKYRILTKKLKI